MMKKKITAWILCAALATSLLCSCQNTESPAEENAPHVSDSAVTDAPETTELTELEKRQLLPDNLPEKNFGGKEFVLLVSANSPSYVVEDYTGAVLNDAKFDRNKEIEQRFDITLRENLQKADKNALPPYVQSLIQAGDVDAFHMASIGMMINGAVALNGCYRNWHELRNVDFTQPWWPAANLECLTINDQAYIAIHDASIGSISGTYCMFYDKVEAENHNLPDVYEIVRSGEWTYDRMLELGSDMWVDTNGDGVRQKEDFYGMATGNQSNMNTYLWAFDNPIYSRTEDGGYEFTYLSGKLPEIIEKTTGLINNHQGVYADISSQSLGMEMFSQGCALFCNGYFDKAIALFGEFEHEYGIIPYPKLDENQKDYATMVDGGRQTVGISKIAKDTEFIGIIAEALAAENYKKVLPVYLDQLLKFRYSSSPDDAEMVDLVLNSRVFDIGYVYDNWKGVSFYVEILARANSTDIMSHYEKNRTKSEAHYASVLKLFEEKTN